MMKQKVKSKTALLLIAVVSLFVAGIIAVTLYQAMQEQQEASRLDNEPSYLLPTDPNAAPTAEFLNPASNIDPLKVEPLDPFQ